METDSGAKIAIRGKGSVKEGKGRSDAAHTSNQEEDLHCLIMADTEEKINKAKKLIHNVIETAASIPEGQNELKRNQLRELAALNGTLRDDENQACQNCGEIGHRKYDCPHQRNFTANIICRVCGNAGHMARDCPDRQRGASWRNDDRDAQGGGRFGRGGGDVHDQEYESLMKELSGGGQIGNGSAPQRIESGQGDYGNNYNHGGREPKPWQRGPTGAPAPWQRAREERESGGSARPWANGGRNDSHGHHQQQHYQGGYDNGASAAPASAAPWHQSGTDSQQSYQGYGGYSGYGNAMGYGQPPGMTAPPGMAPPPGIGAPYQGYGGNAGVPPPPPPPGDAPPPPPPGDAPPPPPPSDQPPPPSGR